MVYTLAACIENTQVLGVLSFITPLFKEMCTQATNQQGYIIQNNSCTFSCKSQWGQGKKARLFWICHLLHSSCGTGHSISVPEEEWVSNAAWVAKVMRVEHARSQMQVLRTVTTCCCLTLNIELVSAAGAQ